MKTIHAVWSAGTVVTAGVLGTLMFAPQVMQKIAGDRIARTVFLPGETTHGHYQIELDCESCHTDRFNDLDVMQSACTECHGAELDLVDDSHPRSKFTDPRNADRVASLDARYCITCHQEHRPEITATMGLSLPGDYCYRCHETVAEERPTHEGLAFDSCASSGCHNFHDNRALYEDFLVEHRDEPDLLAEPRVRERSLLPWAERRGFVGASPLSRAEHDGPASIEARGDWIDAWAASSHAASGINCTSCHTDDTGPWRDSTRSDDCLPCHQKERDGFLASRHGMRLAAGLSPMTPGQARLPMHEEAFDRELGCASCHAAHAFETRRAAVEACLGCHADEHSLAYEGSPHHALWLAEQAGGVPSGSGVSCATCHLPRVRDDADPNQVRVAHNQNDFLRPNDKMIRAICMACHGLAFSIDALADPGLVANNFRGRPQKHVESIHYAAVLRWELEGRPPPWQEEEKEGESTP